VEIANMTFGIQFVHLSTGPWKQVLEPYGKAIRVPIQNSGFCQCQEREGVKKKKEGGGEGERVKEGEM
jgi:hypothetical protein